MPGDRIEMRYMEKKTKLILGFIVSLIGVAIIIISIVDYLTKSNRLPSYVGLIGLVIAVIGRSMNSRNLLEMNKGKRK
jgi:hypothetical protein